MWDAIAIAIKAFTEKYTIPFVISIVVAIGAIIVLPSDYWMIEKVGRFAFGVMISGTVFLAVLFLVHIVSYMRTIAITNASHRYYKKENLKQAEKTMRELWSRVDRFPPEDRAMLHEFVRSGNKPLLKTYSSSYYDPYQLLGSEWVESTVISGLRNQGGKQLYKLKEEVYQALKYSQEHYGKISNFEGTEETR